MLSPSRLRAPSSSLPQLALAGAAIPLLLTVTTADSLTRADGYSITRHWVSLLALGERGWLGTTTLAVCGLLLMIGAPALRTNIGDHAAGSVACRRAAPITMLLGTAMVCAAIVPLDPVSSYPPGSEITAPSLGNLLHNLAGITVAFSLAALPAFGFLAYRRTTRQAMTALAASCAILAGGSVALCSAVVTASGGTNWDAAYAGTFQRLTVLGGGVWIVALAISAAAPSPLRPAGIVRQHDPSRTERLVSRER